MAFLFPADDDRSAKGIILVNRVTAETAAALSGFSIQYIRRLAYEGKAGYPTVYPLPTCSSVLPK